MPLTAPAVSIQSLTWHDRDDAWQVHKQSFGRPLPRDHWVGMYELVRSDRPFNGFLAWRDGHAVGLVVYQQLPEALHVEEVCVVPGMRRQGIGRQLFGAVLARLTRERPSVAAVVNETNLDACRFFKAMGLFDLTELRPGAFGPRDGIAFSQTVQPGSHRVWEC